MYDIVGGDLDVARFLERYLQPPGSAPAEGAATAVACAGAVPLARLAAASSVLVPEFGPRVADVPLEEAFAGIWAYTVHEPLFQTRDVNALLGTEDERTWVAEALGRYGWADYEPDAPDLQRKHVACTTEPALGVAATASTITTVARSDDEPIVRTYRVTQIAWHLPEI